MRYLVSEQPENTNFMSHRGTYSLGATGLTLKIGCIYEKNIGEKKEE
jgi:hypothetical protein